jgi:hypothetical protein
MTLSIVALCTMGLIATQTTLIITTLSITRLTLTTPRIRALSVTTLTQQNTQANDI